MLRALLFASLAAASAAEFPQAEIANGVVRAKFYLPDAERGYYRATRFDWSGVIYSLQCGGHEYFGQWFEKYDAKIHDAIMGPVEEYKTNEAGLGYAEAAAGGTFIRIGVGVVRKPEERAYGAFKTYEIVDPGRWRVRARRDRIEFVHRLADVTGYAYEYRKTVRLEKGKPEMVIEHELKNTGRKAIETTQYNHNFFVMDGKPTGPEVSVKFAFAPQPVRELRGAEVRGNELVYLRELEGRGQSVFTELKGFGDSAQDYDIRVEHRGAGAGVRIRGDRPLVRLVFWSIRTTVCPEPYILLRVEPGRSEKWAIRYEFYGLHQGERVDVDD